MQGRQKKDTWVDHFLDFVREHRLPNVLESIACWIIYAWFISFYTITYLLSRKKYPPVSLVTLARNGPDRDVTEEAVGRIAPIPNKDLVTTIRSDESLRRLASQFMLQKPIRSNDKAQMLYKRLDTVWMELLRLPSLQEETFLYEISLILPAYGESGAAVAQTLRQSYENSVRPLHIQVIVVDAGHRPDLEAECMACQSLFGDLQIVSYQGNGGRGPTLNCGALHAKGKYLTFLHSDTLLPPQWDQRLVDQMQQKSDDGSVVHASTFTFGHNLTDIAPRERPRGLTVNRICGNFRARFLKLPFGDHVLSFPSTYFWFVGGFPEQPIMEDYVMMDLLRRRAALLPERLGFIGPPGAQCSIRRWQTFGVVYVTLVNALVVYRYKNGYWHAGDVFDYYYKRPFRNSNKKRS